MIALIQFSLPTLSVALAIGIATGWWMFARGPAPPRQSEDSKPS